MRLAGALLASLLLAGCLVRPLDPQTVDREPALARIQAAYADTVAAALHSSDPVWTSGWSGNLYVNYRASRVYGLCFHWKKLVYAGVVDTVQAVGWRALGIVVNQGTRHEHHAVLVYDPRRLAFDDILAAPGRRQAYVLDAWRNGRAEIYTLGGWLRLAGEIQVAPRLLKVKPDIPLPPRALETARGAEH